MGSTFYLGTHKAHWLRLVDYPLFVSTRTLRSIKKLPVANTGWALDSGGFTEISLHGRWQTTAMQYVAEVKRYTEGIGKLDFASIQDWMCEPWVVKKTGLSIAKHQELTINSYLELNSLAPLNWLPVLQGYKLRDYLRHLEMYALRGVDLTKHILVGIGSVCRREATKEAEEIIRVLVSEYKLKLHGFGFKIGGLRNVAHLLTSADSMAWSFGARKVPAMAGHTHKTCANCLLYASEWRARIINTLTVNCNRPKQMEFNFSNIGCFL